MCEYIQSGLGLSDAGTALGSVLSCQRVPSSGSWTVLQLEDRKYGKQTKGRARPGHTQHQDSCLAAPCTWPRDAL